MDHAPEAPSRLARERLGVGFGVIDRSLNRLAGACSSAFGRTRAVDCSLSGQHRWASDKPPKRRVPGFPLRPARPGRDDFAVPIFRPDRGTARPKKFAFPAWIFLPLARWNAVESAASGKNG